MTPELAIGIFTIVMIVLGVLIYWEYRRLRRPPGISPEKLRSQLSGPLMPYTAPPQQRTRSMDRMRTA